MSALLQVLGQLAVVAHHGEVQGVDPLEIFRIEHVLGAGARRRALAEIGLEQGQHRAEHREARRAGRLAAASRRRDRSGSTRVNRTMPGALSISATTRSSWATGAHQRDRRARSRRRPGTAPRRRATRRSGSRPSNRRRDEGENNCAPSAAPLARGTHIARRDACGQRWRSRSFAGAAAAAARLGPPRSTGDRGAPIMTPARDRTGNCGDDGSLSTSASP